MNDNQENFHRPPQKTPWWKSPSGMVFFIFIGLAGYFLIKEHSAHIGTNWIWLIFLLCPLMHVFMHGGHGGHDGHDNHDEHHESHHDNEIEEAYKKGLEEGLRRRN